MKKPVAVPVDQPKPMAVEVRAPRVFAPSKVVVSTDESEDFDATAPGFDPEPLLPRRNWLARTAWATGGLLVSLGIGMAADALIRDLFARYEWLGWLGLAALVLFVITLIALAVREFLSVRRLRVLEGLRHKAVDTLTSDQPADGREVVNHLVSLYADRADLARGRQEVWQHAGESFDGAAMVRLAERALMVPLDSRARALTAAAARRVALVTAISPRALVDIAYVAWESIRLGGAVARLYGARPGLFGTIRLAGAILSHFAVTGGLLLTDGVVEQLIGQGAAAKLSARLGEGVVNGLMTVRVGIAAIRVVRPLPFDTQRQPVVRDFIPELANVLNRNDQASGPAR